MTNCEEEIGVKGFRLKRKVLMLLDDRIIGLELLIPQLFQNPFYNEEGL